VSDLNRRLLRTGNRFGVWLYRTFDGRVSGGTKDAPVLLVTTPGRRTGVPRSTCVRCIERPEGYVVWGTGSGSREDPDWFRNLRAASVAEVQVGRRRCQARPRELLGAERDTAWNDLVLARLPRVEKYSRKAGRTIPVAVLEPLEASRG
jgi:deazaflavin-dependent oxidoreductase (nitroreductase family)